MEEAFSLDRLLMEGMGVAVEGTGVDEVYCLLLMQNHAPNSGDV